MSQRVFATLEVPVRIPSRSLDLSKLVVDEFIDKNGGEVDLDPILRKVLQLRSYLGRIDIIQDEWKRMQPVIDQLQYDVNERYAGLVRNAAEARAMKEKRDEEKREGIEQHGSDQLRRCIANGPECDSPYIEEHCACEFSKE